MKMIGAIAVSFCCFAAGILRAEVAPSASLLPVPSKEQLEWQRAELTMFLHFGVNTFTDREWGDGKEDPNIFNPTELDCRQWARVAKDAEFKLLILTAKHHDGFCLWPSKLTDHCVRSSKNWRGGKGDVVREFADACKEAGLKHGLYLSPWDRHEPSYAGAGYNDFFKGQITELLSAYPPVFELWHDGAKGDNRPQDYDWLGYWTLAKKLQPGLLIAICGPDVRWVGNESGVARENESSVKPVRGDHAQIRGVPDGTLGWYPAECDVSIRPSWFWHASQDSKVKSLDHLLDIYFKSVGRNSVLLLNVPPNNKGLIADPDVHRLREFRKALDEIFNTDFARGAKVSGAVGRVLDGDLDSYWQAESGRTAGTLEFDLGAPKTFNVVRIQEAITLGERVSAYHVEAEIAGQWRTITSGSVIGHKQLRRIAPVTAQRVRLVIDQALACPAVAEFGLHFNPHVPVGSGSVAAHKPAKASDVHGNNTNFGADKAVDDDPETRWATNDPTRECWLEVDLLQPTKFSRLTVSELQPRVQKFQLEYRDKETDPWRVAYAGTTMGTKFSTSFPPVAARYVRLHILEASFAPTIWEFRVFPQ